MLKQVRQYLISCFSRSKYSVKRLTSASDCFRRCNTNRKAVFLPTPGSFPNSSTACSNSFDEKFIFQNYENKEQKNTPEFFRISGASVYETNLCVRSEERRVGKESRCVLC